MKILRASSLIFFLIAFSYFIFTIWVYNRGSSDMALKMNSLVHILFSLGLLNLLGVFVVVSAIMDLRK